MWEAPLFYKWYRLRHQGLDWLQHLDQGFDWLQHLDQGSDSLQPQVQHRFLMVMAGLTICQVRAPWEVMQRWLHQTKPKMSPKMWHSLACLCVRV